MNFFFLIFCSSFFSTSYWIVGDSEAGATSTALKEALPSESKFHLTYEVSSRIEKWSNGKMALSQPKEKIDTIIIFLGANNYFDKTLPSPEGILNVVRSLGTKCVWIGPPKINNRSWKLNTELKKAIEPTCKYIDSQQLSISLADGLHPSADGARVWAKKIVEELQK